MARNLAAAQAGETQEFPFSRAEFRFLADLLHAQTGILLNESKMSMVYARLSRRLRELRLTSFADYCTRLQGPDGDTELGTLINALTTNLTRFMREPHHFEHLRTKVLPHVARHTPGTPKRLRIWSAGCSSGEEPYSIAMILAETLVDRHRWDARILATDLDSTMVATGEAGIYPAATLSDLDPGQQTRFFKRHGAPNSSTVIATEDLRQLIAFKELNLMAEWPMRGPFDAIFCRNVMIYFDGPTKTRLVERMVDLLAPGGWLYIGHSESLIDHRTSLTPDGRTVYRKGT